MTGPASDARLADLLETGIELPPAERRRALAARTDDAGLVDEALRLLEGEAALGDFLAAPAFERLGDLEPGSARAEAEAPSIPGFDFVRLLGSGGMGRVWLAGQLGPIEREVAIKVIRPELLDAHPPEDGHEPPAVRRFVSEQRALARLNHPAIAQLYDARTTEDGHPYVVMEHIDGVPITEYCDREALPVEMRLRLFVEVCRGVVHAHRRGLLHRDLKPSNVLVATSPDSGRPTPKIIDFGIARVLDRAETGAAVDGEPPGAPVLGTPAYMSPESIGVDGDPAVGRGDLDTRSDVYSLGVLLFELLAGARPFQVPSRVLAPLLRRIREGHPPAPSARVEGLAEPERAAVAERRATMPRLLVRRLRGDLDAIALRALARDREERYGSAAELAEDIECALDGEPIRARRPGPVERLGRLVRKHRLTAAMVALAVLAVLGGTIATSIALVRATRAERSAREEATAAREVLDFLVDLFESARPGELRGADVSTGDLVARGAERVHEEKLAPLQRARLMHTLAEVQLRLGEYGSGRALAAGALALRAEELPDDDSAVLESLDLLGTIERRAGDLEAAAEHVERLVALVNAREGGERDPALLADALNTLANLRWRQGRMAEAETEHRQALALRERRFLEAGGEESVTASRDAVEDLVGSLNNLAVLLWAQHRDGEAEIYLRRALDVLDRVPGELPALRISVLTNLGNAADRLGRAEESERILRQALARAEEIYEPDHPAVAAALHNLGTTLSAHGRTREAEPAYRRALAIRRKSLGPAHPDTLQSLSNLAAVLARTHRDAEAEAAYREVLSLRTGTTPSEPRKTAHVLRRLADILERTGRPAEAEEIRRRAEELDPSSR